MYAQVFVNNTGVECNRDMVRRRNEVRCQQSDGDRAWTNENGDWYQQRARVKAHVTNVMNVANGTNVLVYNCAVR
jgi:hypothetical protein